MDVQNLLSLQSNKRLQNTKILMLGTKKSGKKALIKSLQQISKTNKFSSIMRKKSYNYPYQYTYLNVQNSEQPQSVYNSKLQFFIFNDEKIQPLSLMQKEEFFDNSIVIITLDLSHSQSLLDSLQKWIFYLNKLKKNKIQFFAKKENYIENHYRKTNQIEDQLPENVLSRNLGFNLIICANKSDQLQYFNNTKRMKIQFHLRRACLDYGASLFYTSGKNDFNIKVLYDFILKVSYNLPFQKQEQFLNEQILFIPFGSDKPSFLEKLENSIEQMPQEPKTLKKNKRISIQQEIICPSDQQFFQKYFKKSQSVEKIKKKETKILRTQDVVEERFIFETYNYLKNRNK